jgi:WD40 repeat protein
MPDGKTIAVAGLDHAVGLYDTAGKQIRRLRAFTANVQLVTFSPDGKCLAATTPDRVIHLCDPRTGKKVRELRGAQAEIRCLAFAPDGKTLATASGQEPVRRWETATGQEIAPPGGHQGWVGYLEYTSDQKHLVTAGWDWTIRVWERATGKQIFSHPALQVQGRTASLSPDGKLLALAREDGSLSVVDVLTGKEQRRLSGHTVGKVPEGRPRSVDTASRAFYGPVVTLAFAPDGKTLASGGADNLVRIWDLTAGKEIHALAHDRPLWKLTYSPDGKLLASGTRERTVRIWDPATARELRQLEHPLPIECFAFSPDGAILAAGGHDGMVAIWDAREGVLRHRLGTNRGFVMTLAFSPDGRTLAVGNWRNLRLWELASGKERATVPAHWGDVTAVAFAADGRSLATASGDSTAIIWDLTGREVGAGPATLAPAELQKLWQRLASADATDADRALWDLTSAPAQAVPFLKQQLVAWRAQAGHPRLARLIHDLDDDDFGVREKATRELAHLGPVAEPALRKVLEGKPSAEVERRVKGLLTSLQSGKSSDVLRATRSLEVLERIGTPEAKTVLQALSEDTDDVASQAKVSLERLDKRTR